MCKYNNHHELLIKFRNNFNLDFSINERRFYLMELQFHLDFTNNKFDVTVKGNLTRDQQDKSQFLLNRDFIIDEIKTQLDVWLAKSADEQIIFNTKKNTMSK
ncbi:MAG: hypothetical protein FH761_08675 [Firmicutes bacterium]|nr:hypothetical protein [Bacillota bacterium]